MIELNLLFFVVITVLFQLILYLGFDAFDVFTVLVSMLWSGLIIFVTKEYFPTTFATIYQALKQI